MEKKNKKILVVEDDKPIRETFELILQQYGYVVQTATNGKTGWELYQSFRPDLVLTDLIMPEMDGIELLEKLKSVDDEVPVIVISGQGTLENTIKALKLGAYDYLTKPVSSYNFLLHAIDKALQKGELIRLARNYQSLFEESVREKTRVLEEELRERKRIEEQITKAKWEWENTIDAIPDLIALYDTQHTIIRLNRAMADFLGRSLGEATGENHCLFSQNCSMDEDCPHIQVLRSGESISLELHWPVTATFFECHILPFYEGERVVGTVLRARDISQFKKTQEERMYLQTRLLTKKKLESVGQLASGIAHEINTPTQYVSSNLAFFKETYGEIDQLLQAIGELATASPDETGAALRRLLEEADVAYFKEEVPQAIAQSVEGIGRIRSIVSAMKEFSHPGGKNKEEVDLNRLIDTTVTVARNEWKYHAEVHTEFADDLPPVACHADEIGQVILNILINAAQAIKMKLGDNEENQKGTITIRTEVDGQSVVIRLEDDGPGMEAAVAERIFDPFFTTKEVGEGTGQGLAIAHDVVVKKHHGSIDVESTPGSGTVFCIRLPLGG